MNMNTTPPVTPKPEPEKIPPVIHVACGWPLAMVVFGGAVGGGLGGLAYGVNLAIYKSKLPLPLKFVLNPMVGLAAVAGWYLAVQAIRNGMN